MEKEKFNIDNFRARFGTGARSYLFEWIPEIPGSSLGRDAAYLVRSSNLPGDNAEEITVNWQGTDLRLAGKRMFEDWNISMNVDYDAQIRQDLEKWMDATHNISGDNAYGEWEDYTSTQEMHMLDYDGKNPIIKVKLVGAWLKSISEISLDYSSQDIAQLEITFTYLYHEIS